MVVEAIAPVESSIRKLIPDVKSPVESTLRTLSTHDRGLLESTLELPVECIFDAGFQDPRAENEYRSPLPLPEAPKRRRKAGSDDSGVDLLAPRTPRLSGEHERHLFLRLNYCRYRVMRILRQFRGKRLAAAAARELLEWAKRVLAVRAAIVNANLPLVLAMAKRTRIGSVDFNDLVSEGNMALLRAVDKFDCSRGFKLSTYACRAILKSFSRAAMRASRYRGHFPTEFDPSLEKGDEMGRKRDDLEARCLDELKSILGNNTAQLNDVEQTVIRARFALVEKRLLDDVRPQTLEQVGKLIGVTKERVRQIQNKALGKLKVTLEADALPA